MRIVSNQFKETMNEIIRPATKLYFEIGTDVLNSITGHGETHDELDDTYVPIVPPKDCTNNNYYAVVGDGIGVDDPNRICAPADASIMPNVSVPYGMTPYTAADTEVLIGSSTEFYNNFNPFDVATTLCFKNHIPDVIRVEIYDFDTETWSTEATIYNSELSEEVTFVPPDRTLAGSFRRFWVKNTTKAGRFQLNWIRRNLSILRYDGGTPVVFENNYVASCNISKETDLTSQTLPSYEMTVECLDPDEEYTPDTDYWGKQFKEGTECFFKLGYEINGTPEYISMFYGTLTKAPTYGEGKITFNVSINWRITWAIDFISQVNRALNTGDIVDSSLFKDIIETHSLFDSYDVFHGEDDERGSECNYFGEINASEAHQLIANALGCFITAGINTVDLHNANDIQYKSVDDYVTRYEQVQATLESQPKVGKIVVTRNENLASANTASVTIPSRVYLRANESVDIEYKVPFFAISKFQVTDYRKSVAAASVTAEYDYIPFEETGEDGMAIVTIMFTNLSNQNTYIQPIITFYGVDNNKYDETETTDADAGETYENNNDLITNGYTAGKVKRVARLINDIPNVYEVDVVQDYRYELGDVIRLETQRNVFKTCVVTGLNFTLPGSNGHITCRKIFSMFDSPDVVQDAEGLTISTTDTDDSEINFTIAEASESGVVIGYTPAEEGYTADRLYVLGSKRIEGDIGGVPVEAEFSGYLTDLNGHDWYFYTHNIKRNADIDTTAPVVELPAYDYTMGATVEAWGVICLLKHLYESQGMTAPVDYTCTVTPVN